MKFLASMSKTFIMTRIYCRRGSRVQNEVDFLGNKAKQNKTLGYKGRTAKKDIILLFSKLKNINNNIKKYFLFIIFVTYLSFDFMMFNTNLFSCTYVF